MHNDVSTHIKNCPDCQKVTTRDHPHKQPLKPLPQPANINHRVHIDLFGPLATSERKNNYILVMTDAFSKMCELVPIPNKEAQTVADAIFDTWICRYGTPEEIVTDNGKEFCNQISEKLFAKLQILHSTTSPYHPQANSQVETFNKTIKKYLRTFMSQPFLDWEQYLPPIRICYNTSVSKAIQTSPFSLMFGISPRMPFFDLDKYLDYDETQHNVDQLTRLFSARQLARQNNLEYKSDYKKQYDQTFHTVPRRIQVGDHVLVATHPIQKFSNKKLHPSYEGPFEVISTAEHTATILRKDKPMRINKDRLKQVPGPLPTPPAPRTQAPAPDNAPYFGHAFAEADDNDNVPNLSDQPDPPPPRPDHSDSEDSATSDFHGFHTPDASPAPAAATPPLPPATPSSTPRPTGTRPKRRSLADDIVEALLPRRSTRQSSTAPSIPPLPDKPLEYSKKKKSKNSKK